MTKNIIALNTQLPVHATEAAAAYWRVLNRLKSTSGSRERFSMRMNTAPRPTPRISGSHTTNSPNPWSEAVWKANVARTNAAVTDAKPGQSTRSASGSVDSSTKMSVRTTPATARGMLTTKNQRQDNEVVNSPAMSGPIDWPIVPTPVHTPMPTPRRSRVKALLTIDNDVPYSIDAPTPCTTRAPISTPRLGATAQAVEAAAKITVPTSTILRRPTMSASRPRAIKGAENASR